MNDINSRSVKEAIAEYEQAVNELSKDFQRTDRQREVERAFGGKSLRRVLVDLHNKVDGNRSEMVRRMNDRLDGEESLSRQTLYNWCKEYDIK